MKTRKIVTRIHCKEAEMVKMQDNFLSNEYKQWFNAIVYNNVSTVKDLISSTSEQEKENLMNNPINFGDEEIP